LVSGPSAPRRESLDPAGAEAGAAAAARAAGRPVGPGGGGRRVQAAAVGLAGRAAAVAGRGTKGGARSGDPRSPAAVAAAPVVCLS